MPYELASSAQSSPSSGAAATQLFPETRSLLVKLQLFGRVLFAKKSYSTRFIASSFFASRSFGASATRRREISSPRRMLALNLFGLAVRVSIPLTQQDVSL